MIEPSRPYRTAPAPPGGAARSDDQICRAFLGLPEGQQLRLIFKAEPCSLRREFERRFPQRFSWSQRRLGAGRWQVTIRKWSALSANDPVGQFLDRCEVFASAAASTRAALATTAIGLDAGRNQAITEQGVDWPFLAAVRSGRVFAVSVTAEGREHVLFSVSAGEVFGAAVILDEGATFARYTTLSEPARLLLFPRAEIVDRAMKDPQFTFALAVSCAQRARGLIELVSAHVSKPVIARVAATILKAAPSCDGLAGVEPALIPSLRLGLVAASAGTVKEVVSRAYQELEAAGAIKRAGGRIAFVNRVKLEGFT